MLTTIDILDLNDTHEFPETPFDEWSPENQYIIVNAWIENMDIECVEALYDATDTHFITSPAPYLILTSECKDRIRDHLAEFNDLNGQINDALRGFVWDEADAMAGVPLHDL